MTEIEELEQIKVKINSLIENFQEKYFGNENLESFDEVSPKKEPKLIGFIVNNKSYMGNQTSKIYKEFLFDLCKNPFLSNHQKFFIRHTSRPKSKGWYRLENTFGNVQNEVEKLPVGGFICTKSSTKDKISHITRMCEELNYNVEFIYE